MCVQIVETQNRMRTLIQNGTLAVLDREEVEPGGKVEKER
jgi:hypothetical protein